MPETKNTRELRREVEALRAQLKSGGLTPTKKEPSSKSPETGVSSKSSTSDIKLIKKDFVKTIILSTFAFGIIISLWILKINLSIL